MSSQWTEDVVGGIIVGGIVLVCMDAFTRFIRISFNVDDYVEFSVEFRDIVNIAYDIGASVDNMVAGMAVGGVSAIIGRTVGRIFGGDIVVGSAVIGGVGGAGFAPNVDVLSGVLSGVLGGVLGGVLIGILIAGLIRIVQLVSVPSNVRLYPQIGPAHMGLIAAPAPRSLRWVRDLLPSDEGTAWLSEAMSCLAETADEHERRLYVRSYRRAAPQLIWTSWSEYLKASHHRKIL
jgi:hypothetical protein